VGLQLTVLVFNLTNISLSEQSRAAAIFPRIVQHSSTATIHSVEWPPGDIAQVAIAAGTLFLAILGLVIKHHKQIKRWVMRWNRLVCIVFVSSRFAQISSPSLSSTTLFHPNFCPTTLHSINFPPVNTLRDVKVDVRSPLMHLHQHISSLVGNRC
jgi:hypothetical protein